LSYFDRVIRAPRVIALPLLLLSAVPVWTQSGLTTINPPQGGTIIYGRVDGQTTEAGAMGAVLHSVHQNVGEKPLVGKLFQVHGTQSVAAFFSATRRNGNGGQIGGLVIVTKVSTDHVQAALVTDEATRFHKNIALYMKQLFAQWHPLPAGGTGAVSGGESAAPAPLHQVSLPDRSAAASIPDGWRVFPNLSGGGTICAGVPNGETAFLGLAFLAADTNNPATQQTMQMLQAGRLQGSSYAQEAFIPYGAEPQKAFVYLFNKSRGKAGMPPAEFTFSATEPMPSNGQARCAHMTGTVDFKDQNGSREMNLVFCEKPPGPTGQFMSLASVTTIPQQLANRERATLEEVLKSFIVDQGVVSSEAARIAAPSIAQTKAIGAAADVQARAAHERNDIQNSSVYQRWDSMDRRSQEFENYQLG